MGHTPYVSELALVRRPEFLRSPPRLGIAGIEVIGT
jgi:hypothetical protein